MSVPKSPVIQFGTPLGAMDKSRSSVQPKPHDFDASTRRFPWLSITGEPNVELASLESCEPSKNSVGDSNGEIMIIACAASERFPKSSLTTSVTSCVPTPSPNCIVLPLKVSFGTRVPLILHSQATTVPSESELRWPSKLTTTLSCLAAIYSV